MTMATSCPSPTPGGTPTPTQTATRYADTETDVGFGPVDALLSIQGYDDLVGAPSAQSPLEWGSASGQRNDSYLWHKVSGTQDSVGGSGQLMPAPNNPLSSKQLDILGAWLDAGAPP